MHLGSTQMGRHDLGTRFDVAAVEQGVAEGLGWGSAKAGVFFVGIDPVHAGQIALHGFLF